MSDDDAYRYRLHFQETTWLAQIAIVGELVRRAKLPEVDILRSHAEAHRRSDGWTCIRVDRKPPGEDWQEGYRWIVPRPITVAEDDPATYAPPEMWP